ncbi:hypothetical protein [Petrachloros mirabilis]
MPRRARRHNPLILPPGKRTGLKWDTAVQRDRCRSIRKADGFELIDEKHWNELADTGHHKARDKFFRYTLDQNGTGSCAAESENGCKAACDAKSRQPEVFYNPLFSYHTTSGGRDGGSAIGDNLDHCLTVGCCPEEIWPRSKGFRATPSSQAYEIAGFFKGREYYVIETKQEFVSSLFGGFFNHFGYLIGGGGHAVSGCRYLKNGKFRFKNSWAVTWGDNGFGELNLSQIYWPFGAYAYRDVVPYYDPIKGWGRWELDGTFTPCPWQPKYDQGALSMVVQRFVDIENQRKVAGQRPMGSNQAEDVYQALLEKCALAT